MDEDQFNISGIWFSYWSLHLASQDVLVVCFLYFRFLFVFFYINLRSLMFFRDIVYTL